jgi:type I restriction enzyme M protein
VLDEVKFQKEEMELTELDDVGLQEASGYVFYNISKWTLKKLYDTTTNSQQILIGWIFNVIDFKGYSIKITQ